MTVGAMWRELLQGCELNDHAGGFSLLNADRGDLKSYGVKTVFTHLLYKITNLARRFTNQLGIWA
jgi:hypothetical protein